MVLIYIDHFERLDFYIRFTNKEEFVFFTLRYSVFLKAKKNGINIVLLDHKSIDINIDLKIDLDKTRDYLDGTFSYNDANNLSIKVYQFLVNFIEKENISFKYCFIWNGSDLVDKTIAKFCYDYNIETIFFEISNLPNRLFIDFKGVNAASSLMDAVNVCDLSLIKSHKNGEYKNFLINYHKLKSTDYVPQQVKHMSKINFDFLIDYAYSSIKGYSFQSKTLLDKLLNVIERLKSNKFKLGEVVDLNDNYLFLPLQVSNDSQIMINSDISNLDAIKHVANEAKKKGVKAYIKVHPAEKEYKNILEYKNLAEKLGVYLAINNTNEMINYADCVYTINSTVGLEALLLGKEVDFLGRTVFKKFNINNIDLYVNYYLFNCDYFGNSKIYTSSVIQHYLNIKKILVKNDYSS